MARVTLSIVLNDTRAEEARLWDLIHKQRAFLRKNHQADTVQATLLSLLFELEQRRSMDTATQYADPSMTLNVALLENVLNSKFDLLATYIKDLISSIPQSTFVGNAIATLAPVDDHTTGVVNDFLESMGW
jgi:hypothetical protein